MASSLISIPEYFTRFIDRSIDLTKILQGAHGEPGED